MRKNYKFNNSSNSTNSKRELHYYFMMIWSLIFSASTKLCNQCCTE